MEGVVDFVPMMSSSSCVGIILHCSVAPARRAHLFRPFAALKFCQFLENYPFHIPKKSVILRFI